MMRPTILLALVAAVTSAIACAAPTTVRDLPEPDRITRLPIMLDSGMAAPRDDTPAIEMRRAENELLATISSADLATLRAIVDSALDLADSRISNANMRARGIDYQQRNRRWRITEDWLLIGAALAGIAGAVIEGAEGELSASAGGFAALSLTAAQIRERLGGQSRACSSAYNTAVDARDRFSVLARAEILTRAPFLEGSALPGADPTSPTPEQQRAIKVARDALALRIGSLAENLFTSVKDAATACDNTIASLPETIETFPRSAE